MYNSIMDNFKDHFFEFTNFSYSKFPSNILAKFCFEEELIPISNTDAYLNVDKNNWVLFDYESDNLFSLTHDQFLDVYLGSNKKSQKYLEFIIDSKTNDYVPEKFDKSFDLFEEIFGDLIEKEIPINKRWGLIFDLLLKRKIYLSKYL